MQETDTAFKEGMVARDRNRADFRTQGSTRAVQTEKHGLCSKSKKLSKLIL